MPQAGSIVWIAQDGAIVPVVVRADRGKTVTAVGPDGAAATVAVRRIVHESDGAVSVSDDAAAAAAAAARLRAVEAAEAGVALRTLWELTAEEGAAFSLEELAELALGEGEGVARDALARVLAADDIFFKARKEGWVPNPPRTVEERERQVAREREEAETVERLAAAIRGEGDGAAQADAVALLEEVALHGDDAPRIGRAVRVFERLGVDGGDLALHAFRRLVKLGHFDEDEDLNLRRQRVPEGFPGIVLQDAEGAAADVAARIDERIAAGRDRRALHAVAIDDETTTEVDDALAVETALDGTVVHVLIADPGAVVAAGTAVDDEARQRGATLYHPVRSYPMLPAALAEDAASLQQDVPRLALDFAITVDGQGHVVDFDVAPAVVRVDRRITYEDANALLATAEADVAPGDRATRATLSALLEVADAFQAWRRARGALVFERREVQVRVTQDGRIVLKRSSTGTPAQRIVSEMMILAGFQAGAFCRDHDIPAVYRRQAPADEPLDWDESKARDRVAIEATLRQLKKAELTLSPDAHATLGVDVYTQVTSPLRRYQDLVMHRQITAYVRGEAPPYEDDELMAIFAEVEETAAAHGRIERDARRYWTLKYLKTEGIEEADAIVLREQGRKVAVELIDYGLTATMSPSGAVDPGDTRRLRITRVSPREDRLVLHD